MRPRPWVALSLSAAAAAVLFSGCSREAPDRREVRHAAKQYLSALARQDVAGVQRLATCVVGMTSVQGGQVLTIGEPRRVTLGTLDSLCAAIAVTHRSADSLWAGVDESKADSLFQVRRRLGYLESVYRNAIRAVDRSHPDTLFSASTALETRTLRVRVRYGGPLVGPSPVDREEILRLLRAPAGRWIAFSMFLTTDDPDPDGV
jgi:hypothetical protein